MIICKVLNHVLNDINLVMDMVETMRKVMEKGIQT